MLSGGVLLSTLAADSVVVAIEAVRVRRQDRESPVRDVPTVQIRRGDGTQMVGYARSQSPIGGVGTDVATH